MMKTLVQTNSTNGVFFAPDHPVILKEALSFFFFLVSVNHNPHSQKKKKTYHSPITASASAFCRIL